MERFITLAGQILLIVCLQGVLDIFIKEIDRPYLSKLVTVAGYAASFYLVIRFVFDNLVTEIFQVFRMTF